MMCCFSVKCTCLHSFKFLLVIHVNVLMCQVIFKIAVVSSTGQAVVHSVQVKRHFFVFTTIHNFVKLVGIIINGIVSSCS